MVMTISQAQILINKFINTSINKQFQMDATVVKSVMIPLERNMNPGDLQGINLYIQTTRDIDK